MLRYLNTKFQVCIFVAVECSEIFELMKNLKHVMLRNNRCISRRFTSFNFYVASNFLQQYVHSVCGVKCTEEKAEIKTCKAELVELKKVNDNLSRSFETNHINTDE
jgi:hypothetical protein